MSDENEQAPWMTRADAPSRPADRATETSDLMTHADPSLASPTDPAHADLTETERARIVWMRADALFASASARVAGRGIDFQSELRRRAKQWRSPHEDPSPSPERDGTTELPPADAYGRTHHRATQRSGPGLS